MNDTQCGELANRGGRIAAIALLLGLASAGQQPAPARADDGPTLDRTSVHISVNRETRYWVPGAPKYSDWTWSWIPKVDFEVKGPVPGGSQFYVEFTKPDGTPWVNLKCPTQEITAKEHAKLETPRASSEEEEKKLITGTGIFGFKIRMKNALAGSDDILMSGNFKVAKFHKGNDLPKFKNQYEFYVDHDWEMPFGEVWLDHRNDEKAPYLDVSVWLKGRSDTGELAAYVFYNGKQIASTKQMGVVDESTTLSTMGMDATDPTWRRWVFGWFPVRGYNHGETQYSDQTFYLDKNPGEYTVKVLRGGELCRETKFTVGDDGKITDNGLGEANKLGTRRIILPVKVLGDADGSWNHDAWKTDAFYGNPLTGFTAP